MDDEEANEPVGPAKAILGAFAALAGSLFLLLFPWYAEHSGPVAYMGPVLQAVSGAPAIAADIDGLPELCFAAAILLVGVPVALYCPELLKRENRRSPANLLLQGLFLALLMPALWNGPTFLQHWMQARGYSHCALLDRKVTSWRHSHHRIETWATTAAECRAAAARPRS